MNEMAFELRYLIAEGTASADATSTSSTTDSIARRNRGEYVRPIELFAQRLTSRA